MKAKVINAFGDSSLFTMVNIPKPEIKPGHLLVKVQATSVNPIDCKVRSGVVAAMSPKFPAILHGDVAGTVEKVGEGVSEFKAGDEIYGCAGGFLDLDGALAEFMVVDAKLIELNEDHPVHPYLLSSIGTAASKDPAALQERLVNSRIALLLMLEAWAKIESDIRGLNPTEHRLIQRLREDWGRSLDLFVQKFNESNDAAP